MKSSNVIKKEKIEVTSVIGFTTPRTMMLEGFMGSSKVVVLIDCGASHNFISNALVCKANLNLSPNERCSVSMGVGEEVGARGICKKSKYGCSGLK